MLAARGVFVYMGCGESSSGIIYGGCGCGQTVATGLPYSFVTGKIKWSVPKPNTPCRLLTVNLLANPNGSVRTKRGLRNLFVCCCFHEKPNTQDVTARGTWSAPGAQDRGLHRETRLPVMFLDLGGVKTAQRFERTVPSLGLDFYRGFLLFRVVFPQMDSPKQTLDRRSVSLSLPYSDGG
jgi:hypothetical protein